MSGHQRVSKFSLFVGLALSLAVHAVLFWPAISQNVRPDKPDPRPRPVAVKVEKPPQEQQPPQQPPPEQQPPAPPPEAVELPPPPDPEEQAIAEVTQPEALPLDALLSPDRPGEALDTLSGGDEEVDDDTLPTLRIAWDSPEQLAAVAAELHMRIVAVNRSNHVLGEVDPVGRAGLKDFDHRRGMYSNRIRALPADYFGSLDARSAQPVSALWILVPVDVDSQLAETQRQAIRHAGRSVCKVSITEGRFERITGRYQLVITRII